MTKFKTKKLISMGILSCIMTAGSLYAMEKPEQEKGSAQKASSPLKSSAAQWAITYYTKEMDRFNPSNRTLPTSMVYDKQCKMFFNFAKEMIPQLGKTVQQNELQYSADDLFTKSLEWLEKGAVGYVAAGMTGTDAQITEKLGCQYFNYLSQLIDLSKTHFSGNEVVATIGERASRAKQVLNWSITAHANMKSVRLDSIMPLSAGQQATWSEMGNARTALKDFFDKYPQ